MKNLLKKMLCHISMLVMLIVGYSSLSTVHAATPVDNTYLDTSSWYENSKITEYFTADLYKTECDRGTIATYSNGQKFPLYITKNGKTYYLNYKLFIQKNLFVYGCYRNIPNNYFKCGYQIHKNLTQLQPDLYYGNGYFLKLVNSACYGSGQNPATHGDSCKKHADGTIRGEWKYLGFDVAGNDFSNMWMINVKTETKFTQRDWQMEPWGIDLKSKTGIDIPSDYNMAAYGGIRISPTVLTGVRNWIAKTVNTMQDYQGIPTKNKAYPSGLSYDAYKFLYIQSPPTLHKSGSGRMWHLRENNVLWYQTFSVPKLNKKEYLPVACTVAKTSIPAQLPKGNELDNETVKLEFEVTGILKDDVWNDKGSPPTGWKPYYQDAASKTVKYIRYDLKSWDFTLNINSLGIKYTTPVDKPIPHPNKASNQGKTKIQVETTVGQLKKLSKNSDGNYVINVSATAKPKYVDNTTVGLGEGSDSFDMCEMPQPPQDNEDNPAVVIDIPTIMLENHIGEAAFDGVHFGDVKDDTDMSVVTSAELYINGQIVDYDTFFSGQYVFPATYDKNGYFAEVICKYSLDKSKIVIEGLPEEQKAAILSKAPVQYISTDYVYVYPTKPNAQFILTSNTWKQNRIINVENNSVEGNIQFILDKYPITEYRWSYGGDTTKLNYGTNTDMNKQLQYKEAGSYSLTLECKNTLGRWSDPYTIEYQVFEDYSPNIEVNLTDSVLTRKDELGAWHYDINSTDGDEVATAKIELWYDANNDGTLETKVQEWNGLGENGLCEPSDFPKYTPTNLGYYKYKLFAKDEFIDVTGQDTLTQYVSADDKKEESYEVEFWVDNYQPLSDLYIDTANNRPNIDLFIMRDKELEQEKQTYISDNRVTMENLMLGRNIIPSINLWDMRTYEYSTPASASSNTGTSSPASTAAYSSEGYSGTLNLIRALDNGGYHDFGGYQTKTETKTASAGGQSTSGHGTSSSSPPSSVSYSDSGGYSGTLAGYGYTYSSVNNGDSFDWTRSYAGYSGTVSRTVSYWVPDMRWVANYTGYYGGTIYKYVRQPYQDPWRAKSSKYILYMSNNNISEIADFNNVKAKTDARIILTGNNTIKTQCTSYSKYIDTTNKSMQKIIDEVIEYISSETPGIEHVNVLQNQTFKLNYGEDDLENDEIVAREMQYVHDKEYFDNPTGQEPNTTTTFSDTTGWSTPVRNTLSQVGRYQIYRRVKDLPPGAYGNEYSYYSGASEVNVYVHRKPIALATLDWDFDAGTNKYRTKWVDQSYDLDHNLTMLSEGKGITQRKLMWRKEGDDWNYTIPDDLSPGTYHLKYYVKDIENTWSDVFTINIDGETYSNIPEVTFTLSISPPMQFVAKLRSEKLKFRTPNLPVIIPASENLELFEILTRYPSNPVLTMELYNAIGTQVSTTKTVNFTNATGKKISNDINWNNIYYNTPKELIDGNYIFKITANSKQSKTISFPVTLRTPINLNGYINGKSKNAQVNTGEVNIFTFTTSNYVNSTELSFEGKTYHSNLNQIKLISDDGITRTWAYTMDISDGAYPDGKLGTADFKAELPSGRSESVYVNYKIVGIRAENFIITMMLDIGWREYYFDISRGIDDNHDGINDRYPRRQNTDIGTLKLPVNYYSLIGHTRTYIKAGYMVKGKIDIQGVPDYAYFKASYFIKGKTNIDNIILTKSVGNTYLFEWIIPTEIDSNSFVSFDLVTKKGDSTYGNEKWLDKWDNRNNNRNIFYIKGNALDDLTFVQSH